VRFFRRSPLRNNWRRKSIVAALSEPHAVASRDFTHKFGRYKMEAQHHAVTVSSYGSVIGYFVCAREYEELMKLKAMRRRVFETEELSPEEADRMFSGQMHPRHDHLNKELDPT
jgi:hypothetical protein